MVRLASCLPGPYLYLLPVARSLRNDIDNGERLETIRFALAQAQPQPQCMYAIFSAGQLIGGDAHRIAIYFRNDIGVSDLS